MIIRKQNQRSIQSIQAGFTILEPLVAIVMVGILMAAIAPVITLSVATRVQARRVELATQAARMYINGIRSGLIATPNQAETTINNATVPTNSGSLTCSTTTTGYPYCKNNSELSLYCIDLDGGGCSGNSLKDLVVQAFRTSNDQNYLLGLRVYRADAFSDSTSLTKGAKQATYTRGIGNRKAPLVEMTTEMNTGQARLQDFALALVVVVKYR